jgi:membrane fusion protein
MHTIDQHLSVRPPSSTKIVLVLSVAFAALIGGAAVLDFSKKEYVTGFVQPQGGDIRVMAPMPGAVRYAAAVGDTVSKGQPLAFIESPQLLNNGRTLKESQDQVQAGKQDSLQTELDTTQAALSTRAAALAAQAHAAQATVDQARAEVQSRRQHVAMEERKVDRQRTLHSQGFLSAPAVEDAEAQLLQRRAEMLAAERSVADAEAGLAAVSADRATLAAQRTSQRQQLRRDMLTLRDSSAQQQRDAEVGVVAPDDAVITARATAAGDMAQAGQLLLRLSPAGAPLEAVLMLPATAAGRVQPGQQVALQLAPYPYQTYGLVQAEVTHVDTAPLVAQEARVLQSSGMAADAVVVAATARILKVPKGMGVLKSGMQFQAAVEIERKSFLAWMLAPLLKHFQ